MKVNKARQVLTYLAAAVAVVSVILPGISRLADTTLGITQTSYMTLATVAVLFAIYLLLDGAAHLAKKAS